MKYAYITITILALLVLNSPDYRTTADMSDEVIVTHDMARETCESMDLVYDYEAEGTTPEEYCY